MRHLLNTLYILSEDIYLSLDGENVVANRDKQAAARYPLHTLQNIITFSYAGASPALMGACAERQIGLAFCSPRGRFLARVCGESNGNVLLRRTQYRAADDPVQCGQISRSMIFGKLFNARWSIERTRRDHGLRVDSERLISGVEDLVNNYNKAVDFLRNNAGQGSEVSRQLRNMVRSLGSEQSLEMAGITANKDGTLSFDKEKLTKNLEKDEDLVRDVISGRNGIAQAAFDRGSAGLRANSAGLVQNSVRQAESSQNTDGYHFLNTFSKAGAYNMSNYMALGLMMDYFV